ncbi:MAG: hypothetical protein RJA19_1490 [Bacteroidota bacterium]|jgi:hypothetical protein
MKAGLVLFLLQLHAAAAWGALAAGLPARRVWQARWAGIPALGAGVLGLLLGGTGAVVEAGWAEAVAWVGLACMLLSGMGWVQLVRKFYFGDRRAQVRMNHRLMDLRGQLARLEERERMRQRMENTRQSRDVMERTTARFQAILVAVEHHIAYGDMDRAERILTTFGKHLRQILHEGSIPFLSLQSTLESIQTHTELMELLTAYRFICDLDEDALDEEHLSRYTESLRLTPWVEALLWPFYERAERSLEPMDPVRLQVLVEQGEVVIRAHFPARSAVEPAEVRVRLLGQDYAQEQRA